MIIYKPQGKRTEVVSISHMQKERKEGERAGKREGQEYNTFQSLTHHGIQEEIIMFV